MKLWCKLEGYGKYIYAIVDSQHRCMPSGQVMVSVPGGVTKPS